MRWSPRRRAAGFAFLILAVGAFGVARAAPAGASSRAPLPAVLAEAMPDMLRTLERIRGHVFTRTVAVEGMTEAEVRAYLLDRLKRDYPDERIAREQRAYVHFGFLEPGQDLKTLFVQMLVDQAAGFYDPEEKRLFLVDGRPFAGTALVHELAHALQDQTFSVGTIIDRARDDDDALLAVQAMVEGEAMALSSRYESMRPARRDQAGDDEARESRRRLDRMPEVLRSNLMFPYTQGMAWAGAVVAAGGEAMMDEMFRRPPESSEQILHPEKVHPPRDLPSTIDPSLVSGLGAIGKEAGFRPVKSNTLGEFNICQLFGGRQDQQATAAASGWDGDRYVILEKDAGTAMIWLSAWDSTHDAAEFRARASSWLAERHPDGGFRIGGSPATARVVFLIEGFEPSAAARLGDFLLGALPHGVTLR